MSRNESRRNAYYADMQLAWTDWQNGQVRRMLETLRRHVPSDMDEDNRNWEWYYLLSLAHQDTITILEHSGSIQQVRWAPNGEKLFSASDDGSLGIWSADGVSIGRIRVPGLERFALSPDGKQVAIVDKSPHLKVFDTESLRRIRSIDLEFSASLVDWSQDGNRIVCAKHGAGRPIVLETTNWSESARLDAMTALTTMAIDPNSKWVAVTDAGTLAVARLDDGKVVARSGRIWSFHGKCIEWHPHNPIVFMGDYAHGCRIEKLVEVHENKYRIQGGHHFLQGISVESIHFSPVSHQLLVADRRQHISIIDPTTFQVTKTLQGHLDWVMSARWNAQENRIASAGNDGAIKLWPIAPPEDTSTPEPTKLDGISPDGNWAYRWNEEEKVTSITDPRTNETVARISNRIGKGIHFFPEWNRVVLREAPDCQIWRTSDWTEEHRLNSGNASTGGSPPFQLAGKYLVCKAGHIPDYGRIVRVNLETGERVEFYPHHRATNLILQLREDGKYLMTGCNGEIKIWDVESCSEVWSFYGHQPNTYLFDGKWSQTGRYVATAGMDQVVRVWDVEAGKLLTDLSGHQSTVTNMLFSIDDSRIMTMGKQIKVWDVQSGREILSIADEADSTALLEYQAQKNANSPEYTAFRNHHLDSKFGLLKDQLEFAALDHAVTLKSDSSEITTFQYEQMLGLTLACLEVPKTQSTFDIDRGLGLARRLVERHPDDSHSRWCLALAQLYHKEWDKAKKTARTITQPDSAMTFRQLLLRARCEWELHHRKQAVILLRDAEIALQKMESPSDFEQAFLEETKSALGKQSG